MTINNKKPWKELNCHDRVFLTAHSSAQQLLSPETHSTFIWIMEKEDQLGRCFFFWSAEGDFDPSSDNSCSTWADFRGDVSFSPGKPPGRCLVDLKAQGRHLIPEGGSLNGQEELAAHFIIVSGSCFWREPVHTGRELLKGFKSHLEFFFPLQNKKEAKSQNTLIRFCLYYCVFSLPLESTKRFIWNPWPWFPKLEQKANTWYLINFSEENETVHIVPIRTAVMQ